MPLYEWQEGHAEKLVKALEEHGVAKDGSDTGTGKTVIAMDCAKRMFMTPFVVAPKAVLPAWREWYENYFPLADEHFVFNYEKLRMGGTQYLRKHGRDFRWRLNPKRVMLIFDEVHRCKGERSLNSKMLASAKRMGFKILMLSATACANPTEMKALGYALGLHDYSGWWKWCLGNGCRKGFFGGLQFRNDQKTLHYLHDSIYGSGGRGSRIRISDLGDAFPETLITAESYDVASPKEIDRIYKEMQDELDALAEKSSDDPDSPLVAQLRARQQVELFKVPVFVDLVGDAYEAGNSSVVFVSFRQTLEGLRERLRASGMEDISLIHGDQTDEERKDNVASFMGDTNRICLCMTQAGGTGLSLHDRTGQHPRVSFVSPTFSAIELRQALGRVHRADGKSKSVQRIVFAAGTVEDRVCVAVRRKLDNLDMINDGELTPF